MASVQLNTRLDEQLRSEGNAALKMAGYTPSETIRIVWEFAKNHAYEPEKIKKTLRELDTKNSKKEDEEQRRKLEAAKRGPHIIDEYLQEAGLPPISPDDTFLIMSPREMKEYIAEMRYRDSVKKAEE